MSLVRARETGVEKQICRRKDRLQREKVDGQKEKYVERKKNRYRKKKRELNKTVFE